MTQPAKSNSTSTSIDRAIPRWYAVRSLLFVLVIIFFPLLIQIATELTRTNGVTNYDEQTALGQSAFILGGVFFYEIVMMVNRLIDRKPRLAILHFMIALVATSVLFISAAYALDIYRGAQRVKTYIFQERYAACGRSAIEYEPGKKFAVCENRIFGSLQLGFFYLVFDSGDQVTKAKPDRSSAFNDLLERHPGAMPNCDFDAEPLRGHLYLLAC